MSEVKLGITARQAQAAKMSVLGKSLEEIAKAVQRSVFTVGEWLKEERVQARVEELQAKLQPPERVMSSGLTSKSEEVLREALFDPETPLAIRVRIAMYFRKIGGSISGTDLSSTTVPTGFSEDELDRLLEDE